MNKEENDFILNKPNLVRLDENKRKKILFSIEDLIKKIKKLNYEVLMKSYFPKNKSKIANFVFDENSYFNIFRLKEFNDLDLLNIENYLFLFLNLLISTDLNLIEKINKDILYKNNKGFSWKYMTYIDFIQINNSLSGIFYLSILNYETNLKRVFSNILCINDYNLLQTKKWEKNKLLRYDELKSESDIFSNPKKISKVASKMTLNEMNKYIKLMDDKNILEKLFLELLGIYKYKKFIEKYHDIFSLKTEYIKNSEIINLLRDDVMHLQWIMPSKNENNLIKTIKSLNFVSKQIIGNEARIGDAINIEINKTILNIYSNSLLLNPIIIEYFRNNIFNLKDDID